MSWLTRLHKESGETGRLGEFFFGLGTFIVIGALALLFWSWGAPPSESAGSPRADGVTAAAIYMVAGFGTATFGAFMMFSGWGRHHPKFESGGDPDVADVYDPEGR